MWKNAKHCLELREIESVREQVINLDSTFQFLGGLLQHGANTLVERLAKDG